MKRPCNKRWRAAVHEVAHALAAAFFLNCDATAELFRGGHGACHYAASSLKLGGNAVVILAAARAEEYIILPDLYPEFAAPPRGPRRRLRQRPGRIADTPHDASQVRRILRSQCVPRDKECREVLSREWKRTALTFVICQRKEIARLARRLYLNGRLRVRAKPIGADWTGALQ